MLPDTIYDIIESQSFTFKDIAVMMRDEKNKANANYLYDRY